MDLFLRFLILGGKYLSQLTAQSIVEAFHRSVQLGRTLNVQAQHAVAVVSHYDHIMEMYQQNLEEFQCLPNAHLAFISEQHRQEFESYVCDAGIVSEEELVALFSRNSSPSTDGDEGTLEVTYAQQVAQSILNSCFKQKCRCSTCNGTHGSSDVRLDGQPLDPVQVDFTTQQNVKSFNTLSSRAAHAVSLFRESESHDANTVAAYLDKQAEYIKCANDTFKQLQVDIANKYAQMRSQMLRQEREEIERERVFIEKLRTVQNEVESCTKLMKRAQDHFDVHEEDKKAKRLFVSIDKIIKDVESITQLMKVNECHFNESEKVKHLKTQGSPDLEQSHLMEINAAAFDKLTCNLVAQQLLQATPYNNYLRGFSTTTTAVYAPIESNIARFLGRQPDNSEERKLIEVNQEAFEKMERNLKFPLIGRWNNHLKKSRKTTGTVREKKRKPRSKQSNKCSRSIKSKSQFSGRPLARTSDDFMVNNCALSSTWMKRQHFGNLGTSLLGIPEPDPKAPSIEIDCAIQRYIAKPEEESVEKTVSMENASMVDDKLDLLVEQLLSRMNQSTGEYPGFLPPPPDDIKMHAFAEIKKDIDDNVHVVREQTRPQPRESVICDIPPTKDYAALESNLSKAVHFQSEIDVGPFFDGAPVELPPSDFDAAMDAFTMKVAHLSTNNNSAGNQASGTEIEQLEASRKAASEEAAQLREVEKAKQLEASLEARRQEAQQARRALENAKVARLKATQAVSKLASQKAAMVQEESTRMGSPHGIGGLATFQMETINPEIKAAAPRPVEAPVEKEAPLGKPSTETLSKRQQVEQVAEAENMEIDIAYPEALAAEVPRISLEIILSPYDEEGSLNASAKDVSEKETIVPTENKVIKNDQTKSPPQVQFAAQQDEICACQNQPIANPVPNELNVPTENEVVHNDSTKSLSQVQAVAQEEEIYACQDEPVATPVSNELNVIPEEQVVETSNQSSMDDININELMKDIVYEMEEKSSHLEWQNKNMLYQLACEMNRVAAIKKKQAKETIVASKELLKLFEVDEATGTSPEFLVADNEKPKVRILGPDETFDANRLNLTNALKVVNELVQSHADNPLLAKDVTTPRNMSTFKKSQTEIKNRWNKWKSYCSKPRRGKKSYTVVKTKNSEITLLDMINGGSSRILDTPRAQGASGTRGISFKKSTENMQSLRHTRAQTTLSTKRAQSKDIKLIPMNLLRLGGKSNDEIANNTSERPSNSYRIDSARSFAKFPQLMNTKLDKCDQMEQKSIATNSSIKEPGRYPPMDELIGASSNIIMSKQQLNGFKDPIKNQPHIKCATDNKSENLTVKDEKPAKHKKLTNAQTEALNKIETLKKMHKIEQKSAPSWSQVSSQQVAYKTLGQSEKKSATLAPRTSHDSSIDGDANLDLKSVTRSVSKPPTVQTKKFEKQPVSKMGVPEIPMSGQRYQNASQNKSALNVDNLSMSIKDVAVNKKLEQLPNLNLKSIATASTKDASMKRTLSEETLRTVASRGDRSGKIVHVSQTQIIEEDASNKSTWQAPKRGDSYRNEVDQYSVQNYSPKRSETPQNVVDYDIKYKYDVPEIDTPRNVDRSVDPLLKSIGSYHKANSEERAKMMPMGKILIDQGEVFAKAEKFGMRGPPQPKQESTSGLPDDISISIDLIEEFEKPDLSADREINRNRAVKSYQTRYQSSTSENHMAPPHTNYARVRPKLDTLPMLDSFAEQIAAEKASAETKAEAKVAEQANVEEADSLLDVKGILASDTPMESAPPVIRKIPSPRQSPRPRTPEFKFEQKAKKVVVDSYMAPPALKSLYSQGEDQKSIKMDLPNQNCPEKVVYRFTPELAPMKTQTYCEAKPEGKSAYKAESPRTTFTPRTRSPLNEEIRMTNPNVKTRSLNISQQNAPENLTMSSPSPPSPNEKTGNPGKSSDLTYSVSQARKNDNFKSKNKVRPKLGMRRNTPLHEVLKTSRVNLKPDSDAMNINELNKLSLEKMAKAQNLAVRMDSREENRDKLSIPSSPKMTPRGTASAPIFNTPPIEEAAPMTEELSKSTPMRAAPMAFEKFVRDQRMREKSPTPPPASFVPAKPAVPAVQITVRTSSGTDLESPGRSMDSGIKVNAHPKKFEMELDGTYKSAQASLRYAYQSPRTNLSQEARSVDSRRVKVEVPKPTATSYYRESNRSPRSLPAFGKKSMQVSTKKDETVEAVQMKAKVEDQPKTSAVMPVKVEPKHTNPLLDMSTVANEMMRSGANMSYLNKLSAEMNNTAYNDLLAKCYPQEKQQSDDLRTSRNIMKMQTLLKVDPQPESPRLSRSKAPSHKSIQQSPSHSPSEKREARSISPPKRASRKVEKQMQEKPRSHSVESQRVSCERQEGRNLESQSYKQTQPQGSKMDFRYDTARERRSTETYISINELKTANRPVVKTFSRAVIENFGKAGKFGKPIYHIKPPPQPVEKRSPESPVPPKREEQIPECMRYKASERERNLKRLIILEEKVKKLEKKHAVKEEKNINTPYDKTLVGVLEDMRCKKSSKYPENGFNRIATNYQKSSSSTMGAQNRKSYSNVYSGSTDSYRRMGNAAEAHMIVDDDDTHSPLEPSMNQDTANARIAKPRIKVSISLEDQVGEPEVDVHQSRSEPMEEFISIPKARMRSAKRRNTDVLCSTPNPPPPHKTPSDDPPPPPPKRNERKTMEEVPSAVGNWKLPISRRKSVFPKSPRLRKVDIVTPKKTITDIAEASNCKISQPKPSFGTSTDPLSINPPPFKPALKFNAREMYMNVKMLSENSNAVMDESKYAETDELPTLAVNRDHFVSKYMPYALKSQRPWDTEYTTNWHSQFDEKKSNTLRSIQQQVKLSNKQMPRFEVAKLDKEKGFHFTKKESLHPYTNTLGRHLLRLRGAKDKLRERGNSEEYQKALAEKLRHMSSLPRVQEEADTAQHIKFVYKPPINKGGIANAKKPSLSDVKRTIIKHLKSTTTPQEQLFHNATA